MSVITRQRPTSADTVVDAIRRQIAVSPAALDEARRRRDLVRRLAEEHEAARRSFPSGSIAHGTHVRPLGDADSGAVMDRTKFPEYGPDGLGLPPGALMRSFRDWILPRLRLEYPNASCRITKRALLFEFNERVELDGNIRVDPTVDLVLALDRREQPGLWIPNTEAGRWDPSHPERHTELLVNVEKVFRVHRARVIRLAKVAVANDGEWKVMCSFNIEALALELVEDVQPIAQALAEFLSGASIAIARGLTQDPAGVSGPIKLPEGVTNQRASRRLGEMTEILSQALAAASKAGAREILTGVFGPQIDEMREADHRAMRNLLVNPSSSTAAAVLGSQRPQKHMRSYGG